MNCPKNYRSSVSGCLDFGMLDGLLQHFEDEVDVVLGGVDAHQADAPDLAGRGTEAAGDLQHVPVISKQISKITRYSVLGTWPHFKFRYIWDKL